MMIAESFETTHTQENVSTMYAFDRVEGPISIIVLTAAHFNVIYKLIVVRQILQKKTSKF